MRILSKSSLRWSVFITALTLVLAIAISFISTLLMAHVNWGIGFFILLFIIFIGIFFDILGIASTAADEQPFHAMGAAKVRGARQALKVVRNADQFSNFCNDVIGDISGIVSGAAAVAVVTQVLALFPSRTTMENLLHVLMTAFVAALTVGGKALGKSIAINRAERIVFQIGKVLYFLEEYLHIRIFEAKRKNGTSQGAPLSNKKGRK